mgnify:FL=1
MIKPEAGLVLQDRYRLIERIAMGGMGEVWRAQDLRSGRVVAAKVMRPELAGDELFLQRLRTEAKNARGLRHPNLAMVLDYGEADGSGWIIMELVQGKPLSELIAEKGTLPPSVILPLLAQTARALQVVHEAGVVHRDVKPSNILVNQEGLAKLLDFGISSGANQLPMTATGMVMGTAQYLAPEQATGAAATAAGDLYSLGVIAYEALAGTRPFTGATAVDIAYAHVNDPVPALPEQVPANVRELIYALLSKKPSDRPTTAQDLARRLDRIIIGLPSDDAVTWNANPPQNWAPAQHEPKTAAKGTPISNKPHSRMPKSNPGANSLWDLLQSSNPTNLSTGTYAIVLVAVLFLVLLLIGLAASAFAVPVRALDGGDMPPASAHSVSNIAEFASSEAGAPSISIAQEAL